MSFEDGPCFGDDCAGTAEPHITEVSIPRERTREEFLATVRDNVRDMVENVVVFDVQNIHETREVAGVTGVQKIEQRLVAQTVTFWYDEDAYHRARLLGVKQQ